MCTGLIASAGFPEEVLDNIVPLAVFTVGGVVFTIWVLAATVDSIIKGRNRERTRREIAAYVAEGSMTAEEGERLLKAVPRTQSET